MHFNAPPITNLRLQRIHRWALLWLKRLAAFFEETQVFAPFTAQAKAVAHRWLDAVEKLVFNLVLIRAAQVIRPAQAPRHSSRRRKARQFRRALMGSALRKALRSRDLRARIAALSGDIEVLVLRLVKRLSRGLTRRRPFLTRAEPRAAGVAAPPMCAVAGADTS